MELHIQTQKKLSEVTVTFSHSFSFNHLVESNVHKDVWRTASRQLDSHNRTRPIIGTRTRTTLSNMSTYNDDVIMTNHIGKEGREAGKRERKKVSFGSDDVMMT